MSHARIEEVSDSDLDSDPPEEEIDDLDSDFDDRDILKRREPASSKPSTTNPNSKSSLIDPSNIPSHTHDPRITTAHDGTQFQTTEDDSRYKNFQCIYPVYFDAKRSRREGRMVGSELAVQSPMARDIVTACGRLGLETFFEPAKMHPKDWSNPGRVKIRLRGGNNDVIKNKHHLYILISQHLKANPTTEAAAIRVRVPGVAPPDASKPYPKPAVPKGWKISDILPYYSPAMTGGGVSENFFKDMMAEMGQAGGGAPGGIPGMPDMAALQGMMGGMGGPSGNGNGGGEGSKKKDKKKTKVIRA
ncbi:signal recognition particle, SRP19 subunit [Amylocarpus encephaloides]|uniref:Signal recognition particle, SRP19 subunit n=1 Tax=Amylocarpus encephaloides TaxID=45428 RepID=A0A9P8C536_9HELO|nr:signal recognition particle, SRP19 subunit [Amylocarpus encephaloides]